MEHRLQEGDFAKSSLEFSRLINAGNVNVARAGKGSGKAPWAAPLAYAGQAEALAGRDPKMMSNEARFSSRKLSKRLVAFDDTFFGGDETNSDMPAFVRKKSEEGSGRKGPDRP